MKNDILIGFGHDEIMQCLRDLDEAMGDSKIEIRQGSHYHIGIKKLLEDQEKVRPVSVAQFAACCGISWQAINKKVGKEIDPLTQSPVTIDATRYWYVIAYYRNKKKLGQLQ